MGLRPFGTTGPDVDYVAGRMETLSVLRSPQKCVKVDPFCFVKMDRRVVFSVFPSTHSYIRQWVNGESWLNPGLHKQFRVSELLDTIRVGQWWYDWLFCWAKSDYLLQRPGTDSSDGQAPTSGVKREGDRDIPGCNRLTFFSSSPLNLLIKTNKHITLFLRKSLIRPWSYIFLFVFIPTCTCTTFEPRQSSTCCVFIILSRVARNGVSRTGWKINKMSTPVELWLPIK